jgi:hypothetical protein
MPVIAIIGAVAAIGIAVEVGTTLAIIAAVGATIGAVGAVTGSKALMIAGGVIGAIGGIGALAQSAGILGADAFSFGSNAAGVAGAATDTGSFAGAASGIDSEISQWSQYGSALDVQGNPALSASSLSGAPTMGNGDFIDRISGAVQPVDTSASPTLSNAASPNVNPEPAFTNNAPVPQGGGEGASLGSVSNQADPNALANTGAVPASTAPSAPGTAAPSDPTAQVNGIPAGFDAQGNPLVGRTPTAESLINGGAGSNNPNITMGRTAADPSIWSKLTDVVGKPGVGTVISGVVQAGSAFIAGATNGLTPAQIAALNAQAEANHAAASLSMTQQANMTQPLPVATRSPPVTGAPQGMINTAPRVNVAGAAA